MLAVVFWNARRESCSVDSYADALHRFHQELNGDKPHGFRFSTTYVVDALPWLSSKTEVYEDWYVMANFAAMDALDEAVIDTERLPAHRELMTQASTAYGGIFYLKSGPARMDKFSYAHWLPRPRGVAAEDIATQAKQRNPELKCSVWTRAMALGPSEYCLLGSEPIDGPEGIDVTQIKRRLFWSPSTD